MDLWLVREVLSNAAAIIAICLVVGVLLILWIDRR